MKQSFFESQPRSRYQLVIAGSCHKFHLLLPNCLLVLEINVVFCYRLSSSWVQWWVKKRACWNFAPKCPKPRNQIGLKDRQKSSVLGSLRGSVLDFRSKSFKFYPKLTTNSLIFLKLAYFWKISDEMRETWAFTYSSNY